MGVLFGLPMRACLLVRRGSGGCVALDVKIRGHTFKC